MHERTAELLETLKGEVEALTTTEGWKRWLNAATAFHNYSLNNQLLIWAQRPTATRVAGYQAWQKKHGRQVRKGEKAIRILAPIIRYETNEAGEREKVFCGFRTVNVFDIEQTDGPPIVEAVAVDPNTVRIDTDEDLYGWFEKVAAQEGVTISTTSSYTGSARGWYEPGSKAITIVDGYELPSRTRTLLHELGHHFTPDLSDLGRAEKELIAESAAYIVGNLVGLDTTEYSAFYTAGWANGDTKAIEKVAKRVLATVARLSEALGLDDTDKEESK